MNWLRQLWPRRIEEEFVPTPAQVEKRVALAQAIRLWMDREAELLNDDVILDTMHGEWQEPLFVEQGAVRDKLFDDAYHHLQHFFSDADIRAKNIDYAMSQRNTLTNCIRKLEAERN